MTPSSARPPSALRRFIDSESSGGIVLMAAAAAALAMANVPASAGVYAGLLRMRLGTLGVVEWVNDALMAVFFLLVGLEIKREVLHGQLRTWSARVLPGLAALGGMLVPALIYAALNWSAPASLRGWAIPSATDIAFALGVVSLLGDRVPASLKVFLTALAVLDDLGAVLIIALFYTGGISLPLLGAAGVVFAGLVTMNRLGVVRLLPYLLGGAALWWLVWESGVHSTVAGVLLAVTVPADAVGSRREDARAPLNRLEAALNPWVAFAILPVFAFVNAGVAVGAQGMAGIGNPVTLGVAAGLLFGKQGGVLASMWLAARFRLASRPAAATWRQNYGVALLCGIGFTMSLFIGHLAFGSRPDFQADTKVGVLMGSVLSALAGWLLLRFAPRRAVP